MKTKLSDQQAALLEFRQEPMEDYYQHPLIGIPSRIRVKKIFTELGKIQGKELLDVGCEAGWITLQLADRGAQVTAIDLIPEPINQLKQNLGRRKVKLLIADATKLPFRSNSFDIILATEVIEHITQLSKFIDGSFKILKPGGRLLITFPNENLRQRFYPIVSFFGIKAEVESQVTLNNFRVENIIKLFTKRFTLIKFYRLPWWLPITNLMIFKKPERA
jgi:2-polyprenyl-3-methyl-5-hydroxy-6-metoxy-1,4-benzoquinol methylase